MLRLQGLQPHGLAPVTLDIDAGDCLVVQGPSGSGKTLLLRAIADLDPCPGEAELDGMARSALSGPEWRQRATYVAADSGWWADRVGAHFTDWPRVVARHGSLGLPGDCEHWPVEQLSTGERQRLALLRAIEQQPRVLILDEPTSGLDGEAAATVETTLDAIRRTGTALIWVTHDDTQAARVATRRLTLGDGQAVAA